jgi:GntR family transcriptional regulator
VVRNKNASAFLNYGKQVESKMTKYEIIKQEIKEQIEDNILKPNQVIKSENEMCQCYKVSRVTVRKAIDELCAEGILYRIKGKGCFVREQTDQKRSRIYSFTEAVRNEGKLPGKKQLSLEKKEADAYLADELQIEEGEEVFEIQSLYYADGIPYSLNTAVLPAKRFEKLDFFDFNNRSLYEVLGSFYGTYMYRVRQTLEATTADVSVSRLLERDESQPLLRIKAISYCLEDNQEIPVEYYEAYILTDIQNYYVEKFH